MLRLTYEETTEVGSSGDTLGPWLVAVVPEDERKVCVRRLVPAWSEVRLWLELKSGTELSWGGVEVWPITSDWGGDVWKAAIGASSRVPGPVLFLVRGAMGFAGGNPKAGPHGVAVLGDACLDELLGVRPSSCPRLTGWGPPMCSRDGQMGAMVHELLHLAGLGHEPGTVMSEWWRWPKTGLPRAELRWAVRRLDRWELAWRWFAWALVRAGRRLRFF